MLQYTVRVTLWCLFRFVQVIWLPVRLLCRVIRNVQVEHETNQVAVAALNFDLSLVTSITTYLVSHYMVTMRCHGKLQFTTPLSSVFVAGRSIVVT